MDKYELLEDHLLAGRFDHAEALAQLILSKKPRDMVAQVAMARLWAAYGELDRAESSLASLLAENPNAALPNAYFAVLLELRGEREKARRAAARALSLGAEVPPCTVLIADQHLEEGQMEEALALYDQALMRAPALSSAWIGRGRVLAFRGALADAEDAYIQAVQNGPQRVEAWVELIALERDAGAIEAADENLAIALRTHPGHPDLLALASHEIDEDDHFEQMRAQMRRLLLRGDMAGALTQFEALMEAAPEDPRVLWAEAEIAVGTGRGDTAELVHELTRVTREQPNAWEPKVLLGRLLLCNGPLLNPRMAAALCEDGFRLSGEHPYAGLALVEAWAAIGKRSFALALCQKLADGDRDEARRAQDILAGRFEG